MTTLKVSFFKVGKVVKHEKVLLTGRRADADINFRINSFIKMALPLFSEPVDELSHYIQNPI